MIAGENRRPTDVSGSGLGDILDDLTSRYRRMVDRFGKIMCENEPPPAKPTDYAATEARLAAVIDQGTHPAEKQIALLSIEAHRHEQIGRLAVYIAQYEADHGDPGNVPPMRDLGRDHSDLASMLRGTIADEQERQRGTRHAHASQEASPEQKSGLLRDFVRAEAIAETRARPTNSNERRPTGRDL